MQEWAPIGTIFTSGYRREYRNGPYLKALIRLAKSYG